MIAKRITHRGCLPVRALFLSILSISPAVPAKLLAAPLAKTFTYQGQLKQDGVPSDATVALTFSLWDALGSGDPPTGGTQVGLTQTISGVLVTNGLFTVTLNAGGEFGSDAFTGSARWLQISVNGTPLSPRQPLTAAPAALTLAPGTTIVGPATSSLGSTIGVQATDSSGFGAALTAVANSSAVANDSTYGILAFGREGFSNVAGLGYHDGLSTRDAAVYGYYSGSSTNGFASYFEAGKSYFGGNVGIGTTTPHANFALQVKGISSVWEGGIAAGGDAAAVVAGELGSVATIGGHNAALDAWQNLSINPIAGNVGIGTNSPLSPLDVRGPFQPRGHLTLVNSAFPSTSAASDVTINAWGSDITPGLNVTGRLWWLGNYTSADKDVVLMNSQTAGSLILGTGEVLSDLVITSTHNVGIGTANPSTKLQVVGTTKTTVLEIVGGADIAEAFDIAPFADVVPSGGMVVVIDETKVGGLRLTTTPYDRRVAGVISGANGVLPGIVLGQKGSVADGAQPVASVGRVYVWCDAGSGGPIRAGDLLTTSSTPGHAMKVSDHSRANGAVLGKAMSSLESGRGTVLVLVSLQ